MNITIIILKRWKEILIVILALLLASSVRQCSVNKADVTLLSLLSDSVTYYKNQHGQAVGQIKTYEVTVKQLKEHGDKLGFDNKQLREQVGKESRLVAHWRGKAGTKPSAVVIALRDTTLDSSMDGSFDLSGEPVNLEVPGLQAKTFGWGNKYLTLQGVISLDSNQLSLTYSYETDFSITTYYKKRGLFKAPELVTDIWFEDPNMKVQEFRGFVITQPKKRLFERTWVKVGIGAVLGYTIAKTAGL